MFEEIAETAAHLLGISTEDAKKHSKFVDEAEAYYFWDAKRGGKSVIINYEGEKLVVGSATSYENLVSAFLSGKRN